MKTMATVHVSAPILWALRISAFLFIALAYGASRSQPAGGIELSLSAAFGEGIVVSAYLYLLFYGLSLSIYWLVDRFSGRRPLAK